MQGILFLLLLGLENASGWGGHAWHQLNEQMNEHEEQRREEMRQKLRVKEEMHQQMEQYENDLHNQHLSNLERAVTSKKDRHRQVLAICTLARLLARIL